MIPTDVPLDPEAVDRPAFDVLQAECRRLRFLPTFRFGVTLQVAMPAPADEVALAAIRRVTHQEVRSFGVSEGDFAAALGAMESSDAKLGQVVAGVADPGTCDNESGTARWDNALHPLMSKADGRGQRPRLQHASLPGVTAVMGVAPPQAWAHAHGPARALAHEIIAYAHAAGASDLLLDDQQDWLDISIRRFGEKEILPPVTRDLGAALFRAVKEMSGLSTQTVLTSQSGAARVAISPGKRIDLRVEVTPTVHGESLVARLQDSSAQLARMAQLPFSDSEQRNEVLRCLRQSQGLILATGPTGHGKTSTLYACLGQLDRSRLNIRTLEDPVEFTVPWITQIPIGQGTGRDYASGLKSLLRQAPHVILLGELRDRAAAQTCMEAVETGHLLLATLHTRDAVGVVSRLLDLGLTGRQIAAGLRLAIGQRLVPRVCADCRKSRLPTPAERSVFADLQLEPPVALWEGAGCPACGARGETGLVPVFEIFRPGAHESLEELVACATAASFNERELRRRWLKSGGEPMVRSALKLASEGVITFRAAHLLF